LVFNKRITTVTCLTTIFKRVLALDFILFCIDLPPLVVYFQYRSSKLLAIAQCLPNQAPMIDKLTRNTLVYFTSSAITTHNVYNSIFCHFPQQLLCTFFNHSMHFVIVIGLIYIKISSRTRSASSKPLMFEIIYTHGNSGGSQHISRRGGVKK